MRQPNDDLEHALFTTLRCTMDIADVCGYGRKAFAANPFSLENLKGLACEIRGH